jgi:hypothetical protein
LRLLPRLLPSLLRLLLPRLLHLLVMRFMLLCARRPIGARRVLPAVARHKPLRRPVPLPRRVQGGPRPR